MKDGVCKVGIATVRCAVMQTGGALCMEGPCASSAYMDGSGKWCLCDGDGVHGGGVRTWKAWMGLVT